MAPRWRAPYGDPFGPARCLLPLSSTHSHPARRAQRQPSGWRLRRWRQGRGVREVTAAGDGDGIRKADGGLMLPVELRPAPGELMTKSPLQSCC